MAAPEAVVAAGDTVVDIAPGVGTAQLGVGYGIVALPDCPGSIRQKPSCVFWCVIPIFEAGSRCS